MIFRLISCGKVLCEIDVDENEQVVVEREDATPVVGLSLNEQGGVSVGHWPDGDIWREVLAENAEAAHRSGGKQGALGRASENDAEHAGQSLPAGWAPHVQPGRRDTVWVLRRFDRHDDVVTLHADENAAYVDLAGYVDLAWDTVAGRDGVPDDPLSDAREAVRLYYGPDRDRLPDEGYDLFEQEIPSGPSRASSCPTTGFLTPEQCAEANHNAVFHPQTGNEDLPCIEVAGVMVFAYLNPATGAVHVSVDLDTADTQILLPDGTVPLHVDVQGAAVTPSPA
ncbi:hypothetical protein ACTWP5_18860 [Streptomyces sp. 4N509B]|uniref:hypothetical protein n=1 Tax=Streptomyces sp. 4N509B TaxID=3457413 RepID=UPI003FD32D3C